jgi:hypothetical protein
MLVVSERILATQIHCRGPVAQSGGLGELDGVLPLGIVGDGEPCCGCRRNHGPAATCLLPTRGAETGGDFNVANLDAVTILRQRTSLLFCAESTDSLEPAGARSEFKSAWASRNPS